MTSSKSNILRNSLVVLAALAPRPKFLSRLAEHRAAFVVQSLGPVQLGVQVVDQFIQFFFFHHCLLGPK